MAETPTTLEENRNSRTVAVLGLTNSGASDAIRAGADGFSWVSITGVADTNPAGVTTVTLEGSNDGVNWSALAAATGKFVAASVTAAGAWTSGWLHNPPAYIRLPAHADVTGVLDVHLGLHRAGQ